jgi:hypothetical protein
MKQVPDFENDSSLTPRQKTRRREYYRDRKRNIQKSRQWEKNNPEKRRASAATGRARNRERLRESSRLRAQRNRALYPEKFAAYRALPEVKEYHMAYGKKRNLALKQKAA